MNFALWATRRQCPSRSDAWSTADLHLGQTPVAAGDRNNRCRSASHRGGLLDEVMRENYSFRQMSVLPKRSARPVNRMGRPTTRPSCCAPHWRTSHAAAVVSKGRERQPARRAGGQLLRGAEKCDGVTSSQGSGARRHGLALRAITTATPTGCGPLVVCRVGDHSWGRHFLATGAAAITTIAQSVIPNPAQAQAPVRAALPKRSARDRLEEALARIADPNGEGKRACLTVYSDAARAAADAADARVRAGVSLGPLDGAIISIKDLFDVAGEPTRAGSKVLADAPPAAADAPVVRRLRAAGCVIVAKSNMVEFAFSALGLNPHYGTPGNPADRTRVPGGSSSGAAVAVADGMCEIAIGSDTGGSTRVPAAFCGIVASSRANFGYRPKVHSRSLTPSIPLVR